MANASAYAPIVYSGDFGSGKSYAMVKDALADPHKRIYAPSTLELTLPPEYKVIYYDHPSELKKAGHGVALVDEADLYFDSRQQGQLDLPFKLSMKQARKRHLKIIYGVQHYGSLKKENRQYVKEVRVCDRLTLPVQAFYPASHRKPHRCLEGVLSDDQRGDWFGFGTVFLWRSFPPELLRDEENMQATGVKNSKRVRMKTFAIYPFDPVVGNSYKTRAEIDI